MTTRKYRKPRKFRKNHSLSYAKKRGGGNCLSNSCLNVDNKLLKYFEQPDGNGDVDKVRNLLKKGANSNLADSEGMPVLHKAILFKYKEIVELLLESGADPNYTDSEGNMAINMAIRMGYKGFVKLLLDKGTTHLTNRNYAGQTPKEYEAYIRRLNTNNVDTVVNKAKLPTDIAHEINQFVNNTHSQFSGGKSKSKSKSKSSKRRTNRRNQKERG
jgi:ankyrin repeat protein